eukprot:s10449_g1.t1
MKRVQQRVNERLSGLFKSLQPFVLGSPNRPHSQRPLTSYRRRKLMNFLFCRVLAFMDFPPPPFQGCATLQVFVQVEVLEARISLERRCLEER